MTAWGADAVDATRSRPPRHRLRVDAKQAGYFPRGQQPIPGLNHDLPPPLRIGMMRLASVPFGPRRCQAPGRIVSNRGLWVARRTLTLWQNALACITVPAERC